MSRLPSEVVLFRKKMLSLRKDELYDVTRKLTANTIELGRMWKTIKGRSEKSDQYDSWVQWFIQRAFEAKTLPLYYRKNNTERNELSSRIAKLASQLERDLQVNGLDVQLFYSSSINFRGFWFFEDLSQSKRGEVDYLKIDKIQASRLLDGIADLSTRLIKEAPKPGKAGKNARAILFARTVSRQNRFHLGSPLHAVTAYATNALFDTQYDQSDINKLVTRSGVYKL